jgi:signal transduction histidine kinase
MNNVLLPVLCRLDALDKAPLTEAQRAEVHGIRQSLDFLRQLSRGLRLFALDPDDPEVSDQATDLAEWWTQVSPMLLRAVPADVSLTVDLPEGLLPVRVPAHRVTQAVLNLLVNAGEATGGKGTVRLWAEAIPSSQGVRLCVSDDGHGMSQDVQQRRRPSSMSKARTRSSRVPVKMSPVAVTIGPTLGW